MDKQKEALTRIIGTVQAKSVEAEKFTRTVQIQVDSIRQNYANSISELQNQFKVLTECLEHAKVRMVAQIEEELCNKCAPLLECLKNYEKAKESTEDLMTMSNSALEMKDHNEFSQTALKIKDRVTISPIFRLNLSPFLVEEECFFYADFSRELKLLNQVDFLPVPAQAELAKDCCFSEDNVVHCQWSVPEEDETADSTLSICSESVRLSSLPQSITYFVLQYRQVDTPSENIPWITVEFIRSLQYDINGLCFDKEFLEFRVQAWNQALGGSWSKVCAISTPAFNFSLNPDAAHPNLKITSHDSVEWDAAAGKVTQETQRVKSSSSPRSVSPVKRNGNSPRRAKPKDRFTGESYTVLGDTVFTEEEAYFEVTPSSECKTYSIGITHKSLARFDQLGKTQSSWCLYVSNWIQNSFTAKHNNKVKNLGNVADVPSKIGVYFNQHLGILSFYNAGSRQHIHTFKQVKCNGPILPGFLIWFGSLQIFTGIQVPTWISTKSHNNLNGRASSMSRKSLTPSECSFLE